MTTTSGMRMRVWRRLLPVGVALGGLALITGAPAHAAGHLTGSVHGSVRLTQDTATHSVAFAGVPTRTSAKPGDTVSLPFELANFGDQTPDGEILVLIPSAGLDVGARSSSCAYENGTDSRHARWIICYLDAVPSGRTADYAHALTFRPSSSSLLEDVEMGVMPDTPQNRASATQGHTLTAGTGAGLRPDGTTAGVPSDPSPETTVDPKIDVDNEADLSVTTPSPLHAPAGGVLTVDISVTDNGPADYADAWNENPAAYVEFTPPPGTTVTSPVDSGAGCSILASDDHTVVTDRTQGRPGDHFVCRAPYVVLHGHTLHQKYTLRVDTVVPNATGTVRFRTKSPEGAPMPWDKHAANDTARLVINARASTGTSGGGTTDAGTASASAGADGTGGSGVPQGTTGDALAATGAGPTWMLAGLGGLAGVAGATVLVLVRTRGRRTPTDVTSRVS